MDLVFTPDGRYLIIRNRLWRATNPALAPEDRVRFTAELMTARRDVAAALRSLDTEQLRQARASVNAARIALGERGPLWWDDGAPDYTRHLVKNTPYAAWYAQLV